MNRTIEIVGAGPAGLSAALTVARAGGQAVVYESRDQVGHRFHGDFQGLENWTTEGDVLRELAGIGFEDTFDYAPFQELTVFDPDGELYHYTSDRPLWYLVRRGPGEGTLDLSLLRQVEAAGVEIRLGTAREHLPEGGIVAHGPHRSDAIAVGHLFTTNHPDGAWAALSDDLAPKGYAYLLVSGGRGTLASCMFDDFHNEKRYLERTVEFFRQKVGVSMRDPHPFGGMGSVYAAPSPRKGGLLYAGEGAGFQDALFGFGMRYAIVSGHLAAKACLDGTPDAYEDLCQDRFGGLLKAAVANRFVYERLGRRGYGALLERIRRAPDVRHWLRRYYASDLTKTLLHPVARKWLSRKRELVDGCVEGCDCTWCRCQRHAPVRCEGDPGGVK